jgi:hypothetical protein
MRNAHRCGLHKEASRYVNVTLQKICMLFLSAGRPLVAQFEGGLVSDFDE